ncbi:NADPH:quinone oxidoreductase family protein [Algoriphagus aestuariicola]|uniref:NADPH:quinone oxidoreductase family protein n=1 Tax=Algoriphagus aestuariicola TaxID=1852016 RepID=A0ABS3BU34_9BACT|nr:NADPH:quinone oxidoreductase family protein [Algoriphagus aestuariicola]MBN7802339.1 NADPH:quinone oxidoreductase family protein [Algoriphagus aestuariicola]
MRAVICKEFGLPGTLQIKEIPDPSLLPAQVLISVEACGVNFPDLLMIQNKYQIKPGLPFSPGGEVAGKIIAAGSEVDNFQIGKPVIALCGWGGFAEKVAVDSDRVFPLPNDVPAKLAAAGLYTYSTSYHALKDRANLQPGETFLVLGASGGVGLAAVELGKIMGSTVIAAASSQEKLELCRQKGADLFINYTEEDLKSRIKELTGGKGVDVVFDPVGGDYTEAAIRGMGWKGRYLIVGFASGTVPQIPMNLPLLKGCSIMGVFWGNFSRVEETTNQANLQQLMDWIGEGKLNPAIGKTYSLEEAPEALQAILDQKAVGKGVVLI